VHIWSLRRKLERVGGYGVLETVRGVGYRLVEADLALA
jgi:DNA-binding response OmpR family regulator